ncbi:zinc finger and BTB domain-containing protein [Halocaridina rubra]|uniref:Zinc finger and BTB domain-containing protein n=1 Tax=Halocaridina rubra TaxID=373956 RepID=A0AAN8WQD3_HALRR
MIMERTDKGEALLSWENVRAAALIPVVELRQPVAASTPSSCASTTASTNAPRTAATPPIVQVPVGGAFPPFTACTNPRGITPEIGLMTLNGDKMAFVCQVCGKQFGQPYNLRRHLTTHTGERPYRCPHCNYAASQNVHLEKHIRRIHLNNTSQNGAVTGPIQFFNAEPTTVTP